MTLEPDTLSRVWSARRALPLVVALGLCGAVTAAQAGIVSDAVVGSSDFNYGFGPLPVSLTTTTPGQALQETRSAIVGYYDLYGAFFQTGSVGGSAYAFSDYGVNRVGLATGLMFVAGPPQDESLPGYTYGATDAHWTDTWTIVGGHVGDVVSGVISGHTSYSLSLSGPVTVGPGSAQLALEQHFAVNSVGGFTSVSTTLELSDFMGSAGTGNIDWHLNFTARAGDVLDVDSLMLAQENPCGISDPIGTTCLYAFDSTHSSVFDGVVLDAAYTLTSGSGDLVAHDGGFTYLASLREVSAVAEPGVAAMLLSAGALAAFARRCRRRLSSATRAS